MILKNENIYSGGLQLLINKSLKDRREIEVTNYQKNISGKFPRTKRHKPFRVKVSTQCPAQ